MLRNKSILITGGTGSFGKRMVHRILSMYPDIPRLVVYSRDELKQYDMAQLYPNSKYEGLRFFIGDIRDGERFKRACEGIDYIIHAAALKQVPAAEYNPIEFIKTNILGAENVINAALACKVRRVIALSTDKAAAPINLYGATKLCSDKLFVAANNIKGHRDLVFSLVRYGNVMGSRGSVIPFFLDRKKTGTLPITHEEMTRFNISLDDAINMVLYNLEHAWGGEILVPKIPSYRVIDVAEAIAPEAKKEIIGIRPGEKIHEEMITEADSYTTVDLGDYYAILPQVPQGYTIKEYCDKRNGIQVQTGFKYNSGTNPQFLSVIQLRELIASFVQSGIKVD